MKISTSVSILALFATVCFCEFIYPEEPTPPVPTGPFGALAGEPVLRLGGPAVLVGVIVTGAGAYIIGEVQGSQRTVKVVNELKKDVWVRCRDKDLNIGDLNVKPKEAYSFDFDRSFWGVTHFWCNAWFNGPNRKPTHFPVYNEGAPSGNNLFALRRDGVYLKIAAYNWEKFRDRNNE